MIERCFHDAGSRYKMVAALVPGGQVVDFFIVRSRCGLLLHVHFGARKVAVS
jgi:hypothetical protein